jgi:CheY-like chemotaxis protein
MSDQSPILLVEDNATDVLLIRRALDKASVRNPLHVASDGDMAVAYLAGQPPYDDRRRYPLPGLVLLDLKLPKRSGHEVLSWVKTQPHLARIPVVVLTSSRLAGDVNGAYDRHANSYLVKPVRFDDLLRMMHAVQGFWIGEAEPPLVGDD